MLKYRLLLGSLVLGGIVLAGCARDDQAVPAETQQAGPLTVYTTFYPTQYFTVRIGGDLVNVVCPVPADEDAIFWMPPDEIIQQYQQADLIVVNGAGFAKWVDKVVLPQSRVVDTAKSFSDTFIHYEKATVHSHGMAGEHAHEGLDGHTWVDPVNAIAQAKAIKDALVARLPGHQKQIEQGFTALEADLQNLDQTLRAYAEGYDQKPFFASHPAYNYIARRYDWKIINLDLDPEEMPSDEAIADMKQNVTDHGVKYLVWEGTPTDEIATRMEDEVGVINIVFSPCELITSEELADGDDYLRVMQTNLKNIAPIFVAKE